MKKLKKLSLMLGLLIGFALLFNVNTSNAFQEDPILEGGSWICCKDTAEGCEDIYGNMFPEDEKRFTATCTTN
jgi:hypothetical protein